MKVSNVSYGLLLMGTFPHMCLHLTVSLSIVLDVLLIQLDISIKKYLLRNRLIIVVIFFLISTDFKFKWINFSDLI